MDEDRRPRAGFLFWSLVECPVIAWAVGIWSSYHGGGPLHSFGGGIALLVLIPVSLVVSVGVASNRSLGEITRAAIGSAAIAYGGFVAFVIYFFLTVPDGFFN